METNGYHKQRWYVEGIDTCAGLLVTSLPMVWWLSDDFQEAMRVAQSLRNMGWRAVQVKDY